MKNNIEKYLANKMEQEEKVAFELKMEANPALKTEMQQAQKAVQAIRLEGRAELKNRFKGLDRNGKKAPVNKGLNRPMIYVFGVVVLGAILWGLLKKEEPVLEVSPNVDLTEDKNLEQDLNAAPIPEPGLDTSNLIKEEVKPAPNPIPKKVQKSNRPIADNTPVVPNNNALFAQAFQPYHHPSMRPNVRGGSEDLSHREQLETAYWEKNFGEVLIQWDSLFENQQKNGNLLFLKAVALLEKGSISAAKIDFEQLVDLKRHRFAKHSEWYLALIALKENNLEDAKNRLNKIAEKTRHPFNQEAIELLVLIK